MDQWVKELTINSDSLNLILGPHMTKEKTNNSRLSTDFNMTPSINK